MQVGKESLKDTDTHIVTTVTSETFIQNRKDLEYILDYFKISHILREIIFTCSSFCLSKLEMLDFLIFGSMTKY